RMRAEAARWALGDGSGRERRGAVRGPSSPFGPGRSGGAGTSGRALRHRGVADFSSPVATGPAWFRRPTAERQSAPAGTGTRTAQLMTSSLIANGHLVDEHSVRRADVLLEDGQIRALLEPGHAQQADQTIDASGLHI